MEITKQIIELKAMDLLDSYSGANNYILYMKTKKEKIKIIKVPLDYKPEDYKQYFLLQIKF